MRILGREVSYQRVSWIFYVAVLQAKLLLGSENWVVIPRMARILGGFHHRVVRRITRNLLKRRPDRVWQYPPILEALMEAGLEELEVYIRMRQKMVVQFIYTRTIMNLCLKVERRPGARVAKR